VPLSSVANQVTLRVLAITPYSHDTAPGLRFRIEQWDRWLRREGIEITWAPFPDRRLQEVMHAEGQAVAKAAGVLRGVLRRVALLRRVRSHAAVFLYLEAAPIGPPLIERAITALGVPVIFDFDDAIFIPKDNARSRILRWLRPASKQESIAKMATWITPGNEYLAEWSRERNANVTILPTTIDLEKYTAPDRTSNDVPVIGWSGSFTTAKFLDPLRAVLQTLARTHSFKLRVIGARSYSIPGVDVEVLPWRSATEVEDLRPIDIGLMPLPDDRWARGKCGLKALQYMALGIPAICSPGGVNATIIEHGRNGFLATTDDEWLNALRTLLDSPEMRKQIGSAGRATVERSYSAPAKAQVLAEIIRTVARSRQRASSTAEVLSSGQSI
jgi:glycosyltransferase involved in cell wall biosynthesis